MVVFYCTFTPQWFLKKGDGYTGVFFFVSLNWNKDTFLAVFVFKFK